MAVQFPKRPKKSPEGWRSVLMKERDRQTSWVLKIQSYRTPFLDVYFSIASLLGEEVFFILFLPLSAWVESGQSTVHLTMLLALSVGGGNILKNIFLIPRPPRPPVWTHKEAEKDHGLPSTHTMTAITLPWYYILYRNHLQPYDSLPPYVNALAVLWTCSVVASRVYNGHHTPMDVAAGTFFGTLILVTFTSTMRLWMDSLIMHNVTVIFTLVGAMVSILTLHPLPPKVLTPAHAETGLVTGTASGTFIGLWLRASFASMNSRAIYAFVFPASPTPPQFALLVANPFFLYLLRFVVGASTVILVRLVAKKVGTWFVMGVARMGNVKYTKASFKYSEGEVAVKYMTYLSIGFATVWLVPIVLVFVGLYAPLDDLILPKK